MIYTFRLTGTTFELSGAGISKISGTSAKVKWDNNSTLATVNGGPVGSDGAGLLGNCSTSTCPNRYKFGVIDIFVSALKDGVVVTQDLQAVVTLKLNTEYLFGIGEVPSSWHSEVLKAQAIAARTYASRKLQDSPNADRDDCGCHVFSSTVDQAYVGFSKQYLLGGNRWVKAVNATVDPNNANIGQVVTSSGNLIVAYYSASTGGKTQPLNEWAGSSASYLTSVVDTLSLDDRVRNPLRSWSVTIDRNTLTTRMQAQGVSISDIANVAITGTYSSGGVSQLTLTNSSGATTAVNVGPGQRVTPDELRTMFGAYSTYFTAIKANGIVQSKPTPTPSTTAVSPSVQVTLVGPTRSNRNAQINLRGTVTPSQSGVSVQVQRKIGSAAWKTVGSATTDGAGNWSYPISAGTAKSTSRFRVVISDGRVGSITSKTLATTIR